MAQHNLVTNNKSCAIYQGKSNFDKCPTLADTPELDKFLYGCTHSQVQFTICLDNCCLTDTAILQYFTQGTIVTLLQTTFENLMLLMALFPNILLITMILIVLHHLHQNIIGSRAYNAK